MDQWEYYYAIYLSYFKVPPAVFNSFKLKLVTVTVEWDLAHPIHEIEEYDKIWGFEIRFYSSVYAYEYVYTYIVAPKMYVHVYM